jgi:hypothetical protein
MAPNFHFPSGTISVSKVYYTTDVVRGFKWDISTNLAALTFISLLFCIKFFMPYIRKALKIQFFSECAFKSCKKNIEEVHSKNHVVKFTTAKT